MVEMYSFDDATLKKFGERGRAKMEAEFGEELVINKYLSALNTIKLAR
jgi:hypothetical protein